MKHLNNNWLALSSFGFQIVASILIFGWIGIKVDNYLDLYPSGLIIGLLIGGIFSLYKVWISINS